MQKKITNKTQLWLSLIFSFLFPGLGHLYLGYYRKFFIIIIFIAGSFFIPIVGVFSILGSYFWSIRDIIQMSDHSSGFAKKAVFLSVTVVTVFTVVFILTGSMLFNFRLPHEFENKTYSKLKRLSERASMICKESSQNFHSLESIKANFSELSLADLHDVKRKPIYILCGDETVIGSVGSDNTPQTEDDVIYKFEKTKNKVADPLNKEIQKISVVNFSN